MSMPRSPPATACASRAGTSRRRMARRWRCCTARHRRRSAVLDQAAVLARHGYGVLLYDARGMGRSGGRAMNFGWYGDRDLAAADRLPRHPTRRRPATHRRRRRIHGWRGSDRGHGRRPSLAGGGRRRRHQPCRRRLGLARRPIRRARPRPARRPVAHLPADRSTVRRARADLATRRRHHRQPSRAAHHRRQRQRRDERRSIHPRAAHRPESRSGPSPAPTTPAASTPSRPSGSSKSPRSSTRPSAEISQRTETAVVRVPTRPLAPPCACGR